jgi:hypothetical protein
VYKIIISNFKQFLLPSIFINGALDDEEANIAQHVLEASYVDAMTKEAQVLCEVRDKRS